ncbi:IclR family transcriptional regulator [Melghirimyces profundicolus]|uniref:Glycerol operon regulatory protein n=1 Tax=Melghirimyces profundicolus TaxID=1242148 RepID=A0A2T6C8P1_9BACL|nr:IclR family transcriptional regulator [Melghirimyces profundicolus]PTX64636.1 IclR family transcriptional regulator [Melghirimyces profundicolus]
MSEPRRVYLLNSVKNAMRILHLYTEDRQELGISDMARRLKLSKSTVHRLVQTLEEEGFLEKNKRTQRYHLGWNLLQLSGVVINHMGMFREAIPLIENLAQKWGEAVHIGILEGAEFVYLHKAEGPDPAELLSHIGKRNPASCTSGGKILLAHLPEKYLAPILEQGLPGCGPRSITDPKDFRRHLKEIRETGYVISVDELHPGAVSIATPIRDYTGEMVAALSMAGPTDRIPEAKFAAIADDVVRYGGEISQQLGYF